MQFWLQALLVSLISVQCMAKSHAEKLIMANYEDWSIYSPNLHVANIDATRLTHLVYKSAVVTRDAQVTSRDSYADLYHHYSDSYSGQAAQGSFQQLQQLKKAHPHLQVLISISPIENSNVWQQLALDTGLRRVFVQSAINFMLQHQFDGIEINLTSIHLEAMPLELRQGLTATLEQLKQAMTALKSKAPLLNILVHWQTLPQASPSSITLLSLADFLVLDTKTSLSGSNIEPLVPTLNQASIVNTISWLATYIEPQNIIITIPSHGSLWQKENASGAVWQQAKGSWDRQMPTGILHQQQVQSKLKQTITQTQWHAANLSEFALISGKEKQQLLLYENAVSLKAKLNFATEQQLAGVAISSLHNDNAQFSLLKQIHWHYTPFAAVRVMLVKLFYDDPVRCVIAIIALVGLILYCCLQLRLRARMTKRSRQAALLGHHKQLHTSYPLLNQSQQPLPYKQHKQAYAAVMSYFNQLAQLVSLPIESAQHKESKIGLAQKKSHRDKEVHPEVDDALQILQAFNEQTLANPPILKLLNTMMDLFRQHYPDFKVVILDKENYVAGYQCNALISEGKQVAQLWHYRFVVSKQCHEDLPVVRILQTLVANLDVARSHIKQLLAAPRLLSELHLVATSHTDILYVQAEQGYTGLYIHPQRAKAHIIIRLSQLKQYFEDQCLVQVHRSFLVNPTKVLRAKPLSRNKWILLVPGKQIPISQSYQPRLKKLFPQWFNVNRR